MEDTCIAIRLSAIRSRPMIEPRINGTHRKTALLCGSCHLLWIAANCCGWSKNGGGGNRIVRRRAVIWHWLRRIYGLVYGIVWRSNARNRHPDIDSMVIRRSSKQNSFKPSRRCRSTEKFPHQRHANGLSVYPHTPALSSRKGRVGKNSGR